MHHAAGQQSQSKRSPRARLTVAVLALMAATLVSLRGQSGRTQPAAVHAGRDVAKSGESTVVDPSNDPTADPRPLPQRYAADAFSPGAPRWGTAQNAIGSSATAGLVIATFDGSITTDPNSSAIQAMVAQAVAIFQAQYSDPITVSILFRYATTYADGSPLASSTVATTEYAYYVNPWSTWVNALIADAKTGNDGVANASLPGSPLATSVNATSANGRALGLNTPPAMFANGTAGTGGLYDGIITLNAAKPFQFTRPTSTQNYDALRMTEQKIARVLGLTSALNDGFDLFPQDLFSWSSAGTRNRTSSGSRYFSIDGGRTKIVDFNQTAGGSYGGWLSGSCPQATPYVLDAFSCTGQSTDVTPTSPEGINLDVIGYDLVSTQSPQPPSAVAATISGRDTVTLTWAPPAGGGVPLEYVIDVGSSAGATDLITFSTGNTNTTYTAAGVSSGTYYVRIRARNAAGTSGPSNEVVASVPAAGACGTVPSPPLALTLTSIGGGTVDIAWTPSATGVPTSYVLEAGSATGLANIANADVGPQTTMTATSVPDGTYFVRVRGKNACGISPASNELTVIVSGRPREPLGPFNYVGSYPTPVIMTYVDISGVTVQALAYPGQVQLFAADPTTASWPFISLIVEPYGGSVIGQIQDLGYYLISVPAGTERAFIRSMNANQYVNFAIPNGVLATADVVDLSRLQGPQGQLPSVPNLKAQVGSGVYLYVQDDFVNQTIRCGASSVAHGSAANYIASGSLSGTGQGMNLFTVSRTATQYNDVASANQIAFNDMFWNGARAAVFNLSLQGAYEDANHQALKAEQYRTTEGNALLSYAAQLNALAQRRPDAFNQTVFVVSAGNGVGNLGTIGLDLKAELKDLRERFPLVFPSGQGPHMIVVGGTQLNRTSIDAGYNHSTVDGDIVYAPAHQVQVSDSGCTADGTSFAAPTVANLITTVLATHPNATVPQVTLALTDAYRRKGYVLPTVEEINVQLTGIPTPSTPLVFSAPPQLSGTVGTAFTYSICQPALSTTSQSCQAGATNPTGGQPPYHFDIASGGFLPIGLVIASNGLVTGTPTIAGTSSFSVCAVDVAGNRACGPVTMTIDAVDPYHQLTVSPAVLDLGTIDRCASNASPGTLFATKSGTFTVTTVSPSTSWTGPDHDSWGLASITYSPSSYVGSAVVTVTVKSTFRSPCAGTTEDAHVGARFWVGNDQQAATFLLTWRFKN